MPQSTPTCAKCALPIHHNEGGSDTPLCDDCWLNACHFERGLWAGIQGWGVDHKEPRYHEGHWIGQRLRPKPRFPINPQGTDIPIHHDRHIHLRLESGQWYTDLFGPPNDPSSKDAEGWIETQTHETLWDALAYIADMGPPDYNPQPNP